MPHFRAIIPIAFTAPGHDPLELINCMLQVLCAIGHTKYETHIAEVYGVLICNTTVDTTTTISRMEIVFPPTNATIATSHKNAKGVTNKGHSST